MSGDKAGWREQYQNLLPKAKAEVRLTPVSDAVRNCCKFAMLAGISDEASLELGISVEEIQALPSEIQNDAIQSDPEGQIKALLRDADLLETQKSTTDMAIRKKRIQAAVLIASLIDGGERAEPLYKKVGINHPRDGANYCKLGKFYKGLGEAELSRREEQGKLLSLNQAAALEEILSGNSKRDGLPAEEHARVTQLVLDECPEPDQIKKFGAEIVEKVSLKEQLGISDAEVEAARQAVPAVPRCDVRFEDDKIIVSSDKRSVAFVFAGMTESEEKFKRVSDMFDRGCVIEIRGPTAHSSNQEMSL